MKNKTLLYLMLSIVTGLTSIASFAETQTESNEQAKIEIEVWRRMYEGRIGKDPASCLYLEKYGNKIEGFIWPKTQACALKNKRNKQQSIGGTSEEGKLELRYTDKWGNGLFDTIWNFTEQSDQNNISELKGKIIHLKDNFEQEVTFQQRKAIDVLTLPYRMTFTTQETTTNTNCGITHNVSAINIYQNKNLVQSLTATSQRDSQNADCMHKTGSTNYQDIGPYVPELIDINFDGFPDIMLTESQGPVIESYNFWTYNPQTKLFEEAPKELQEITNIGTDPAHKVITSGGNILWPVFISSSYYQWQKSELKMVDSASNYIMATVNDGAINYCSITPFYSNYNGKINFSYTLIEERGKLQLYELLNHKTANNNIAQNLVKAIDENVCNLSWDITQENPNLTPQLITYQRYGKGLRKKSTFTTKWEQNKELLSEAGTPKWCPNVPAYDLQKNKIAWHIDTKGCLDEKPINLP